MKPLAARLDEAPLPPGVMAFIDWAARYACEPPGEALALALRGVRAKAPPPERLVRATGRPPTRATDARTRVLAAISEEPMKAATLAQAAGVSSGVVKALIEEGVLEVVETAVWPPSIRPTQICPAPRSTQARPPPPQPFAT